MFKSFYKKLIIIAFGQYIENFDDKIIEVSSWEGNFKAENLIIKKDALLSLSQSLGIPLEIGFGLIKKIELQVEWDKIFSQPSYLILNDVHLLAKTNKQYDQNFNDMIKAKLKNSEIEKKFKEICENIFNEKYQDDNFSPNVNWRQKLFKSFTQNINIIIDNIHIRFEENFECKKFNFGIAISRLEWLNSDKNGEEYFMNYETRKSVGKSFSTAKLYRLTIYFNSNGGNFNQKDYKNFKDEKNEKSFMKNFSLISNNNYSNKNENDYMERISTLNESQMTIKSFMSTKMQINKNESNKIPNNNKNTKIIKNTLTPIYEQFYEFSSKIFNFSSLEYSNQNFIIEPIDLIIKLRKNYNSQILEKMPLTSIFFESSQDINIKLNDNIIYDLIYLFNLKKFHEKNEPKLGIKKDFLQTKFTKIQLSNLFKNCVTKLKKNNFNKDKLLEFLNLIKNYKEIYYQILLNLNDYTENKLSREELMTCQIDGRNFTFLNLAEMQQKFMKIEYNLDYKLVYKLRLQILVKFKNYLINDFNKNKPNDQKKSLFNIFGLFSNKNIITNTNLNEKSLEDNVKENYELINSIIESKLENILENKKTNDKKKIISFLCVKINNFNFHFFSNINQKISEILKFNLTNFIFQNYSTNFAKKIFFVCDDISLYDESLPHTKFKYIFSKSKLLNLSDRNTIFLKTCFDEIMYDNDGFLCKISNYIYKNVENHFIKFYQKKFIMNKLRRNKILFEIKENDFFVNFNFLDNLVNTKNSLILENEILMRKMNIYRKNLIKIKNENLQNNNISQLDFYDINISKTRILFLFNLMSEDYRSLILQHEGVIIKSENFVNFYNIQNIKFFFTNNFLILLNGIDKTKENKIIYNLNINYRKNLILEMNRNNIENRINVENLLIYFDKIVIENFLEYFLIVKSHLEIYNKNYNNFNFVFDDNDDTFLINDEDLNPIMEIENVIKNINDEIIIVSHPHFIENLENLENSINSINSHLDNEFEEALESLENQIENNLNIESSNDLNKYFSKSLHPITIQNSILNINIKTFGIFLEDIKNNNPENKNYLNILLNNIQINEIKNFSDNLNNNSIERNLNISKISFNFDNVINNNYIDLDFCDLFIKSNQTSINTNNVIDINLNNLIIQRENINNLKENIFFYRKLIKDKNINFDFDLKIENKHKISYTNKNINNFLIKINFNNLEFYYDQLENELSRKKIILNSKIVADIKDKNFKIEISDFNLNDYSKSFIFSLIGKNKLSSIIIEKKFDMFFINIEELNISVRNSIINNLKSLQEFKNYLDCLKLELVEDIEINNNIILENNIHNNKNKINLELNINQFKFSFNLFDTSVIELKINKIKTKITENQQDISIQTFKLYLIKIKNNRHILEDNLNLENYEFISLSNLILKKSSEKTEIILNEKISIKVLFYFLPVIKDLNKFYMNFNSVIDLKTHNISRNQSIHHRRIEKSEISFQINYIEITIIDFFLKEKLDEITNNNNFYLKILIENITFYKNTLEENFKFGCSFFISWSNEKIFKAYVKNKINEFNLDNSHEEIKNIINFPHQNITISMKNNQLLIDCNLIKIIITENILSIIKLFKKYSTLFKHYILLKKEKSKSNNNIISSDTSSHKMTQILFQTLKLDFLKIKFENIFLKFKSVNEMNGIKNENDIVIHFAYEFFFSHKNKIEDKENINENNQNIQNQENLLLQDFSSKISNIELYFSNKIHQNNKKTINEDNYLIYPFEIVIISQNDINVNINSIEVDFSIKKIAIIKSFLALLEDLSLSKNNQNNQNNPKNSKKENNLNKENKISKRELIKQAFFQYREINLKINNFTFIIAKEDILNLKLYEPLFCVNLENFKLNYSEEGNNIFITSEIKSEYFNSFNEFWEPIIEKSKFELIYHKQINYNNFILDFDQGLNIVMSLQFLKTLKVFLEDKNNLEKYKNSINTENLLNLNLNEDLISTSSYSKSKMTQHEKTKSVSYKFLNNYLHFENILMRNTYQFQIENTTGEDLLMIVDDKHVIKISNLQTIPIEKILLLQNDIFTKISPIKNSTSVTSLNSFTSGDFKSTIQEKFKQQNERLKELKFIKYIYFQIPQLKKTFCINLLKNNQEIEIITENNNSNKIKILVTIYIDSNGRKVVSLKSPILIKNNFSDLNLEMQFSNNEDFSRSSQLFNIILKPQSNVSIPIRYLNYNYFKIRPFVNENNYYQPYNYSDAIVRDFNILKMGKIITSQIKKNENKNLNENVKMICNSEVIQFDKFCQYEIIFDYTIEIFNYVPGIIYVNFNTENENVINNSNLINNKNVIRLNPFTLTQFNFLSPEDLDHFNILQINPSFEILKKIDIIKLKINGSAYFDYNFIQTGFSTVKILFENVNKKIILIFYVDYIIVNELDENVSLNILNNSDNIQNNNSNKIFLPNQNNLKNTKTLEEISTRIGLNKMIQNNSNNIINNLISNRSDYVGSTTRKMSLESDLISITKISESKFNEKKYNRESEIFNKLDQSVNFIHFDSTGYDKILQFYSNKLPKILIKEIPINSINNFDNFNPNFLTINSKLIIKPNIKNSLYHHINNVNNIHNNNNNISESNLKYFSCTKNDKIILKIDKSEEIIANFIQDPNNIYKNHLLKMTYKNKNMLEILCNVKNLNEFFKKDQKNKSQLTKIIYIKNKYILVNNSNLNLIVTQEGCFNEGFFVIHPLEKLNFKWINYEKPLMIKLKINESTFTNSFNIENVGEFYLNLKLLQNHNNHINNLILKISVVDNQGKILIFIEESTHDPHFTIENNTNKVFKISEKDKRNNIISQPLSSLPFCFDDLTQNNVEVYECEGGVEEIENNEKFIHLVSFNMNKFEKTGEIIINENIKIKIMKNENMNFVLKITEANLDSESILNSSFDNLSEINNSNTLAIINNNNLKNNKILKKNKNKFIFKSLFIGISFIDLTPKEIMYLHIKNLDFNFSVYNKKIYKIKSSVENIQIDNSLENQYYEIIFKTLNNNYINKKSIDFSMDFSYNQMGNIMFVNKLNCQIMSEFLLNLDGIYIFEIFNFFKNIKKILNNEKNITEEDEDLLGNIEMNNNGDYGEYNNNNYKTNNQNSDRIKILFNQISIPKISILFTFRPSFKLIKNLSKSQKLLFLLSRVENMNLIFDKFESNGIKSLETISTIILKNFMKKNNEIITKYLLSLDILLNISNIFNHFKYGLDSIFDSIKFKKNDSIFNFPKQFIFGIFNFVFIIFSGVNSSFIKFFVQVQNITDFYYGNTIVFKINESFTEEDMKKKWYLYPTLENESKVQLMRKFMFSKKLYFFINATMNNDYNKLLSLHYFSQNYPPLKIRFISQLMRTFQNVFIFAIYPLKLLVNSYQFFNEKVNKSLSEKMKMKKIRPSRYINKNSCKIEEYSETRALAFDKLIKNKKFLNILEEIENYFNLNSTESIILTNLRIIYVFPNKNDSFNLQSINLDSIFFYYYEEMDKICQLHFFYYDEKTQQKLLNKINEELIHNPTDNSDIDYNENGIVYFNVKKKNNFNLKILKVETLKKRSKNVLKSIYDTLISKKINKTISTGNSYFMNSNLNIFNNNH